MSFTFQGYDVGDKLYDGIGSHVYRARQRDRDLPVILKVLKPAFPPPERLACFRREYETLRALSSPGIVKAYSLETDDRRWILVQEDIGGQSLDHLLKTTTYTIAQRIQLALHIVDALAHIHAHHIIHKDINPSNVIVNPNTERLILIDFGISTPLSSERSALRHPHRLEGTLLYIAPEQTGRMNRNIDYRSDFYSLGITLYQLFTGKLPFTFTDPMELVHAHLAHTPIPPHQQNHDVPPAISAIIMKLLAKMAEDRYQSSYGIQADLRHCLQDLTTTGSISSFQLAHADLPESFHIPQKLYGRDAEIAELLGSFKRTAADSSDGGHTEMVLVTGYSGIGKSVLVHELHRAITGSQGYFTAGKFDQLQRSTPYAAVVSAFRSLARQLLGERDEALAVWRARLLAALAPNACLVTDVIPEIERIIGPQPPVPELGANESQNRFNRVFQSFVRVFAQRNHPLVLFLDDLQWADSASLKLIELMMTDDQQGHLLLIGAYRDNEVDQAHPLMLSLTTLRNGGAALREIHLPPLQLAHITEFVADTLYASPTDVDSLARLVARKTEGNPLFMSQLLKEVHADGLIQLDRQRGQWLWDIDRIQSRGIADNVVDLMIGKLRRHLVATQEALQLAACLGNRFDVETLALIREQPLSDAFASLLPAIAQGLLLPTSEPEIALPDVPGAPMAARGYRFLHDRVQQAAYSLMDVHQRKTLHLRIGRLIQKNTSDAQLPERVFEMVDQLNVARDLIDDHSERTQIARLNLLAGQRAKHAAAFPAARHYLSIAHELLHHDLWNHDYDLACNIYRQLAECEAVVGNFPHAEALTSQLLAHVRTDIEKAQAYNLVVGHKTMLAQYPQGLDVARRGLALLGIDLPMDNLAQAVEDEQAAIQALLADRPVTSLMDLPLMDDPLARTAMKLLVSTIPIAYFTSVLHFAIVITKMVRMSLQYGVPPGSEDVFVYYGHLLAIHGHPRQGYQFAELSTQLSDKYKSAGAKCRSCFMHATFLMPWIKPLQHALLTLDEGYKAGLDSGETTMGGYVLFYKLLYAYFHGTPIQLVLADLPAFLQFNQRAQNQICVEHIFALRRAIAFLTGVSHETESEEDFLRACENNGSTIVICYYGIFKSQALYLLRKPQQALQEALAAEKIIATIAGNWTVAILNFYTSLCLVALIPSAADSDRQQIQEKLDELQRQMDLWVDNCPQNFTYFKALVAAERARVEGRHAQAIDLYDLAVQHADETGFPHNKALANELIGRFWIERGKPRIGLGYLAEALYAYKQWGASAKVADLIAEFPELTERSPISRQPSTTATTDDQDGSILDLGSVLKASRTISSEIVLDKLLNKLMQIVIQNAGAQRGILLLDKGGELAVYVESAADRIHAQQAVVVHTLTPAPVTQYEAVCEPIVVYVHRTGETVLLGDACNEGPFTLIPYVQQHKLKSVLAMPLSGQGKLIGILYLENNLTTGAFTASRLEVLKMLSSQIGISLENALLYSEMEQRVVDRTAELYRKNIDLQQALANLKTTQEQLIHSEKMASLGQLTAGIAHEIRNPLNFISNFAAISADLTTELLATLASDPHIELYEVEQDLRNLGSHAEKIVRHGERAESIIRSMMQHARTGSTERRPVDLNGLVEQYVDLAYHGMAAQQQTTQVAIDRHYADDIGQIELNPQEMGRVLVNLLNNAFYAVLDKQKNDNASFIPTIRVFTRRIDDRIELKVIDNGSGIPAAVKEKIFEPFFTTKPPGSGTGLGLSLTYDVVVRLHRGTIAVESEEGQGTTFTITLPTAIQDG